MTNECMCVDICYLHRVCNKPTTLARQFLSFDGMEWWRFAGNTFALCKAGQIVNFSLPCKKQKQKEACSWRRLWVINKTSAPEPLTSVLLCLQLSTVDSRHQDLAVIFPQVGLHHNLFIPQKKNFIFLLYHKT